MSPGSTPDPDAAGDVARDERSPRRSAHDYLIGHLAVAVAGAYCIYGGLPPFILLIETLAVFGFLLALTARLCRRSNPDGEHGSYAFASRLLFWLNFACVLYWLVAPC